MVAVFNTLRAFMSQATQDAIRVYGYDKEEYSQALLEMISPDQLPIQYGGTKPYVPVPTKTDAQTWNWKNPIIERIFENARTNTPSRGDDCNPKPNAFLTADEAINEITSELQANRKISTESPPTTPAPQSEQHPHRHGHGLDHHERNTPKPESGTDISSPNVTDTDTVPQEDHFFTDNELETNVINTDISKNDADHFDVKRTGFNINDEAEESATVVPGGSCDKDCDPHSVHNPTSNAWKSFDDDFLFENTPADDKLILSTAPQRNNAGGNVKLDLFSVLPLLVLILQLSQYLICL